MIFFLRSVLFLNLIQPNITEIDYCAPLGSPLGIELQISGNFGELRANHFHTGIDFKTNGKEGYKLHSIADGYISRIKTGTNGYGKVLYVDHPQYGITSVYAHCQSFTGVIAEYTLLAQQEKAFYEIDIQVPPFALAVKKGDNIALSGDTGTSFAPHLHFEIRETHSENPLNPLLFDAFRINDNRAPHIQSVVVYALSKHGYRLPGLRFEAPVKLDKGVYSIAKDTLNIPAHFCSEHGGIGLALAAHDKVIGSENLCGIYQGFMTMNNDTIHKQIMNRLNFDVNTQINTHKDYEAYRMNRAKIEKYFRTVHNRLPIYDAKYGKGILGLQPEHYYDMYFEISDIVKNVTRLKFVIQTLAGELRSENTPFDQYDSTYWYPDSSYTLNEKNYRIQITSQSLFEPVKKKITFSNNKLTFGDERDPINESVEISLSHLNLPNLPKEKLLIYNTSSKSYLTSKIDNEWVTTKTKQFGVFSLTCDTIAPQIKRKFKIAASAKSTMRFSWSVSDDKAGLAYYALYIDNVYHLLEYEHKSNELFASVNLSAGTYKIRMIAKDAVGNQVEDIFDWVVN